MVGFIAYYIHHLETRPSTTTTSTTGAVDGDHVPIMLLAGYSYGAMVTTRVPPLDTVLAYFATPAAHTAEADIRLRAQHLAEAQNTLFADPASPRSSLGIRVGGDEDGSPRGPDRQSISGFLREERIQESVRNLLAGAKLVYREYPSWSSRMEGLPDDSNNNYNRMDHCLEKVEGDVVFHSAYLVVSPPVGFVTRLATLALNPLSSSWMPWAETAASRRDSRQLTLNPTLVVYGDRDGFMGLRKMREWTRQLSEVEASRFRYVEVAGAGHFWAESDVIYQREFFSFLVPTLRLFINTYASFPFIRASYRCFLILGNSNSQRRCRPVWNGAHCLHQESGLSGPGITLIFDLRGSREF